MQLGEVLLPVHAVVEPVEDQEQHGDRDERDDRLEPLAVARQRPEHGLRDDPGDDRRAERKHDPAEQRAAVATLRPHHAGHERSEDQDRFEAFAEDDHRAVRHDRDVRAGTAPDPLLGVGERRVERGSGLRELAGRRLRLDEANEAVAVARAVPEERFDTLEERRRETAKPLLGPELEDPVRLDPRRLRGAPVAARGRGLHAVERCGDDVEVRGLCRVLPLCGVEHPEVVHGRRDGRVERRRIGRRPAPARRDEARSEAREHCLDAARRRGVAGEQARLEIGERRRSPVAERDRLLDLEILRDASVADPAPVLDRDEAQEPVELAGPP